MEGKGPAADRERKKTPTGAALVVDTVDHASIQHPAKYTLKRTEHAKKIHMEIKRILPLFAHFAFTS